MQRILILTAGPLCRNPRVLKEATALGQSGLDVTVLTLANSERFEAYDEELVRGAPFAKIAVDRLSRAPLVRFRVFSERLLEWLARRAIRLGFETPASLGSFHALKRAAHGSPADLTILHTEIPFLIGASLIAKGRRVAADFADWHSRDLLPADRAARPLRLLDRTEQLLMRSSEYTSSPSREMATALKTAYGGPMPVVLPNTFPLQLQPRPLIRQDPPSFFWFSQTIGEGRGLEAFLTAWTRTRVPSQVCLLGDVSKEYRERIMRLVSDSHRSRLTFLPLVSPRDLPGRIAQYDIGLALEPSVPESRFLTATNKIFQYMNAGLAILATPTAGQKEVLSVVPGAGVFVDLQDSSGLAARLDALLEDPSRLASMGGASRGGAEQYFSWEHFTPLLVASVRRALGPKESRS